MPIFMSRGVMVRDSRVVGKDHLKLLLDDSRVVWDAIAFRQGSWAGKLPKFIDVAYELEARTYNGETRLQLNVRDLRPYEE